MLYLACPFTTIFAHIQYGSHNAHRILVDETEARARTLSFAACSGKSPMKEAAVEGNPGKLDGAPMASSYEICENVGEKSFANS